jgi:CubicO group peptidase (beta-lactamase class C family)
MVALGPAMYCRDAPTASAGRVAPLAAGGGTCMLEPFRYRAQPGHMRYRVRRRSVIPSIGSRLGLLVAFLPSFLAAQQPSRAPAVSLAGLDEYVSGVMKEWHLPGLALGVIKDGQPVILKGYGFRDVEHQQPVTARTLMAIGSNSKSFTVVLMGILVDSGKLDWDKPVRTYLPDFQLYDAFATQEMRPRDLVIHNSGLPRHDALWYGRSFTREELYRRLRHLQPNASFRSRWQYQNLMFVTAGYLVEQMTARSWEDMVRERVFRPLDMRRSNTSVRDLPATDDYATPYLWRPCPESRATDGGAEPSVQCGLIKIPYRNIDAVGPAGSINSSVEEMLHYIQFHIDSGAYNGKPLLSKQNIVAMQNPQMLVGGPELWWDDLGWATYGMGLSVSTYRGHKLVQHGGGIDGFISQMSWMPKERIGVMVLTNMSGNNPVPNIVTRNVLERLLGLDQIDWVARTKQQQQEAEARRKKQQEERAAERKAGTTPTHALAAYAGDYDHPGYGRFSVQVAGDGLEVSYEAFRVRLKHFHYDVFEIEDPGNTVPLSGRVSFLLDRKGDVDRMAVPLEPNVPDIVLTRVPK